MKIVLATRNRKKIEEIRRIWQGSAVDVVGLEAYPDAPEVEEDGTTFAANAEKKARAIARHTGCPALSDDSGLVVAALGGAPGVYSARYAGPGATDGENLARLMAELANVAPPQRQARFECVLALALPDGRTQTFTGEVRGHIALHTAGDNGFGYDPAFVPEGYDRTFAQMSGEEKDALSHRGRALSLMQEAMRTRGIGLLL